MLTYEKFMEIVPEETKEFVESILNLLNVFIIENHILEYEGDEYGVEIENNTLKKIAIFCYGLSNMEKYSSLMGYYNFNQYDLDFDIEADNSLNYEQIFNHCSNLFLIYENESDYYSLLPIDLLSNLRYFGLTEYMQIDFKVYLFSGKTESHNFFNNILGKANKYKEEYKKTLELETLANLPIATIDYFKTALKIRNQLEKNLVSSDKTFFKKSNDDYVPLSLLLAIYYYNNSETEELVKTLKKFNITKDKIEDKFKPEQLIYGSMDQTFDINIFKKEYMKYLDKGVCEDKYFEDITITDIFTNLLERDITESYIIEILLNNNGDEYNQIYNEITDDGISDEDIRERLNDFYNDLSNETREFIGFSNKTYQLIKKKMLENKHNTDLLFNDADVTVLSLYIANCYFDGNINKYFTEYGNVTLDKVLKLINIDISKEEIESIEIDNEQMIESYEDIIYDGENCSLESDEIDKNRICLNICDCDFTESLILKNSFNRLSNFSISSNFSYEMTEYFEEKEEEKQNKLSQELFHDMRVDTIEFLEDTSRIHNYILSCNKRWYQKDLQVVCLLASALYQSSELSDFLNTHNFLKFNSLFDYFDIEQLAPIRCSKLDVDIEILINEYNEFIFKGFNNKLDRKDITINDIFSNIFSKELNNSIIIDRLLSEFNIKYKDKESFNIAYQKYKEDIEYKKLKEDATKLLDNAISEYPSGLKVKTSLPLVEDTLRIHKRIVDYINRVQSIYMDVKDIEKISFIISLLIKNNKNNDIKQLKYFCEKNELTISNILQYCKLINLDLTNLEEEIDYELVLSNYKKYIDEIYNVPSLIKKVILNKYNDSTILKDIVTYYNGNYNILEEELTTLKEHELSLSERIALLTSESVNNVLIDDIDSILNFGNCLAPHSKYIYDELPKLMLGDASSKATETINGIIDKVYVKEEKKKSWFEKIFLVEESDKDSKLSLNPEAIKELKEAINSNISILSKELLVFDKIRKYIEIYQKKNYEYLTIAKDSVEKLEKENSNYTDNDEDYVKLLSCNTHLRIMQEKTNRFMTSNQLMKQEIFKINQVIVNHFITINTLEMARDDLLPLVGSELAINMGRTTENNAIELSQSVMGLFQSLLTRNIDTAKENMEKISSLGINNETLEMINRDIFNYIGNLEQMDGNTNSNKVKKLVH